MEVRGVLIGNEARKPGLVRVQWEAKKLEHNRPPTPNQRKVKNPA